jgi:hypothetical protein
MSRLLHDIKRLALVVLLPLLMAMAPAMAQTVVYVGDTTPLSVVQVPGDSYEWELYSNGSVNFATTPGNCPVTSALFVGGTKSGAMVNVKWLLPGTYFFKVIAHNSTNCTNNLKMGIITVLNALPTATISPPAAICVGETASLPVTLTGTGPWEVTFTDGAISWTVTAINTTPYLLQVSPKTTTNYSVTKVKDLNGINSTATVPVMLQVNPKPASSKIYLYQP